MANGSPIVVTPRLVLGAALALMGVVLMLDRVGLLDAREAFRLWPALIIAAGAMTYSQRTEHSGRINGIILMAIGGWLLLNTLGIVRIRFWDLFWPLVLIAAGAALLTQTWPPRGASTGSVADPDRLTIIAVLSGVRRASSSTRFRGGDIAAFMGGGRLDLRQATIPAGEAAVIDVLAIMGGFEILVPPHWVVETPVVPFMGGIEDRRHPSSPTTDVSMPGAPRLVLRGFLMMSGLHIRS